MQRKGKRVTPAERAHIARVKALPCSVCSEPGPSDAHHIDQDCAWTCVALCKSCHQGPVMGWHGEKRAWRIFKVEPIDALGVTIQRLMS